MVNNKLNIFFEDIKHKTVTFLGLGISHIDLVQMFAKMNISVSVRDKKDISKFDPALISDLQNLGIKLILGSNYLENIHEDIVFRTPGMDFKHPILAQIRQRNGVVTSEMELFFDLCPCKIFGITGSDGKTTTTTIISEILKASGYKVHLGGNIGRALFPIIESISPHDYAVVELSSFQLISMRRSPDVSIITNISPNHLDVHYDMDEYINAKENIFIHQGAFGRTVLNFDNETTRHFCKKVRGTSTMFSRKNRVVSGAYLGKDGYIYISDNGTESKLFNKEDILLPGVHNIENYLAAISATNGYVDNDIYKKVATSFKGVEHRIELVKTINGVKWYNDSIATTPSRTLACLNALNTKVILIAGGYDKNIPFDSLSQSIIDKVSTLILMGDTAINIERAVKINPNYNPANISIIHVKDLSEAVTQANKIAVPEDTVILSPASASYGLYINFEYRGKHFKELVTNL